MMEALRQKAETLKKEVCALYLAYRDPRIPWYAKAVAAVTVAYAASPIDLIPDFIPVLGLLDDLLIVPLGITLSVKLVPPEVMAECRNKAQERVNGAGSLGLKGALIVISVWLTALLLVVLIVLRMFRKR